MDYLKEQRVRPKGDVSAVLHRVQCRRALLMLSAVLCGCWQYPHIVTLADSLLPAAVLPRLYKARRLPPLRSCLIAAAVCLVVAPSFADHHGRVFDQAAHAFVLASHGEAFGRAALEV